MLDTNAFRLASSARRVQHVGERLGRGKTLRHVGKQTTLFACKQLVDKQRLHKQATQTHIVTVTTTLATALLVLNVIVEHIGSVEMNVRSIAHQMFVAFRRRQITASSINIGRATATLFLLGQCRSRIENLLAKSTPRDTVCQQHVNAGIACHIRQSFGRPTGIQRHVRRTGAKRAQQSCNQQRTTTHQHTNHWLTTFIITIRTTMFNNSICNCC
mmetsp:Transcript_11966/g.19944  ORF Transcript_11966/g.19944 Transcript_11966/m.19944 type:complete len:215 (-) Transcript_11966:2482-3126(-)